MLHFVSPHRAEGASPHFPRRGESQNAVTEGILQPHVGPCSYIPSPACESSRYIPSFMLLIFESILHSSSRGRSWIKHRRCLTQMAFRLDRESSSLPMRGSFRCLLNPAVQAPENADDGKPTPRHRPCVTAHAKTLLRYNVW
jgi:hypothetical protein